jgi:hypothetical protein
VEKVAEDHIAAAAVAAAVQAEAAGKLGEHNLDDNFGQTMEQEVEQADDAAEHEDVAAVDGEIVAALPTMVGDSYL